MVIALDHERNGASLSRLRVRSGELSGSRKVSHRATAAVTAFGAKPPVAARRDDASRPAVTVPRVEFATTRWLRRGSKGRPTGRQEEHKGHKKAQRQLA